MLSLLKNGRVISVQTNLLHINKSGKSQDRGRVDNTARIQIVYGYANYDTYSLRLDLAHKEVSVIHWNNRTPGGVRCCLFSEQEKSEITAKYPQIQSCFIEYGKKWALKERCNCVLSEKEWNIYEKIRQAKEHEQVFSWDNEVTVILLIDIISRMLPEKSYVPIDKEELHAGYCFNLDKIMFWIRLLYLACISMPRDETRIQSIIEKVISTVIRYKLISEGERHHYANEEGICFIADLAQERISSRFFNS